MTEQMMIDLALANQAEIYEKKLAQLRAELAELRADNERLEKVYQLAVAECVKACNERDMHKRNWTNTMEHRDRLQVQAEQLRAELDEARKRMRYIRLRPSEAIEIAGAFLSTHPEDLRMREFPEIQSTLMEPK